MIEKGSGGSPQTIVEHDGTSWCKEPKVALEALKGVVLKDQKYLFEKRLKLVKELALTGHKVIF